MSTHLKKQLLIISLSVVGAVIIAIFFSDTLPSETLMPQIREQEVQTEIVTPEVAQTAIEGVVLANNKTDQLQVRLILLNGEKEVTLRITEETILSSRQFINGQIEDKKTSLAEVSIGDEVGVVVLTNEVGLADASIITPLELIFRG